MRKREDIHMTMSSDQVSRLVVMGVLVMLLVFVTGYYVGKRSRSEEYIKQDAFADTIYSSLSTPSEETKS